MNITYRMSLKQADAMDHILCTCHDNESDKESDGYGVDLLETIWLERCKMALIQPVDGIIAWTLPRWFPLEMIVEQYGPELERETTDGTWVPDVYDAVAPLLRREQDALQAALLALYTAQERYETIGFYDDDNDENDDEVAAIDMAIVAVKGVVNFEDDLRAECVAELGGADATAVIREAILALHENWTEYYGPNGERQDIEPDRVEQFQALMRLSEQVRTASRIELITEEV